MTTYSFDQFMFPSLSFADLAGGYNSIGYSELAQEEQDALMMFVGSLGDSLSEFDPDNILLVKASASGILTNVYGASIFKGSEGMLVLKLGNNEWAVSQQGASFKVGSLSGELSFADKAIPAAVKDDNGEEREVELWQANVEFMLIPDGDEDNAIEYRVRCAWDAATEPKPPTIKAKLKAGKNISSYFRSVPNGSGGGTEAVKMQDLGEGEFEVLEIRSVETKYGDRYLLKLADEQEVWSRGNVDIQLKDRAIRSQPLLRSGVKTMLLVSDIVQGKDGKFRLNCALRERKTGDQPLEVVGVGSGKPADAKTKALQLSDDIPF